MKKDDVSTSDWDQIDRLCMIPERRKPGEVTARDRAARWGCTEAAASNRLNRAVKRGVMKKRCGLEDGRSVMLYSAAENAPIDK